MIGPVRKPPPGWWPREWHEQAKSLGMAEPPTLWLTDALGFGVAYVTVAYNVPKSTPFERGLAAGLVGPEDAVAAANALVELRNQRPALATEEMLARVWPGLSREQQTDEAELYAAIIERDRNERRHKEFVHDLRVSPRTDPEAMLARYDMVHRDQPRPEHPSHRWLRVEAAMVTLRERGVVAPTQADIARACVPGVHEDTIGRWLREEPDLRALLPDRHRRDVGKMPEK
jgi:hypothetical protein